MQKRGFAQVVYGNRILFWRYGSMDVVLIGVLVAIASLVVAVASQFVFFVWKFSRNDLMVTTMWSAFLTSGELDLKRSGWHNSPMNYNIDVVRFLNEQKPTYDRVKSKGSISWESGCTRIMLGRRDEMVQICHQHQFSVTAFIRMALAYLEQ